MGSRVMKPRAIAQCNDNVLHASTGAAETAANPILTHPGEIEIVAFFNEPRVRQSHCIPQYCPGKVLAQGKPRDEHALLPQGLVFRLPKSCRPLSHRAP